MGVCNTTTVDTGDITPATYCGRMIAMVLMLVVSVLIGSVTSTLTSFHKKKKVSLSVMNKINYGFLKMYDELNDSEKEIFTQTILSR